VFRLQGGLVRASSCRQGPPGPRSNHSGDITRGNAQHEKRTERSASRAKRIENGAQRRRDREGAAFTVLRRPGLEAHEAPRPVHLGPLQESLRLGPPAGLIAEASDGERHPGRASISARRSALPTPTRSHIPRVQCRADEPLRDGGAVGWGERLQAPATIGEEGVGTQQPLTQFLDLDCARDRVDQSFFASRADSRASCFVFRLPCRHSARDFSSPFLHSALASRAP
jgi:hypothetical protein